MNLLALANLLQLAAVASDNADAARLDAHLTRGNAHATWRDAHITNLNADVAPSRRARRSFRLHVA